MNPFDVAMNPFEARRAARNQSTKDTCPCTIWMHEVVCAAIKVAPQAGEISRKPDVHDRLLRAYNAGEAVWMAADGLALRTKATVRERRGDVVVIRVGSRVRLLRAYALESDIGSGLDLRTVPRGDVVTVTRVQKTSWGVRAYHVTDGEVEFGPVPRHVLGPVRRPTP